MLLPTQQKFAGLQGDLKMSSRHVLKKSSTHLQCNNFTSCEGVLKTSWKTKNCYAEDIFKMSWRHLQDVLKTCLEDALKTCLENVLKTYLEDAFKRSWRQTECLLGISISNKCKCQSIFNKPVPDESNANPNALIRTQSFWNSSCFQTQAAFLFEELKPLKSVTDQVRQ